MNQIFGVVTHQKSTCQSGANAKKLRRTAWYARETITKN